MLATVLGFRSDPTPRGPSVNAQFRLLTYDSIPALWEDMILLYTNISALDRHCARVTKWSMATRLNDIRSPRNIVIDDRKRGFSYFEMNHRLHLLFINSYRK